MSLLPILWALKHAPVADTTEKLIVVTMAEHAFIDGCDCFPSKNTMAEIAMTDPKTVQRKLRKLQERKLIALGDQTAARYIDRRYRPQVYDLLIPYSFFPDIAQVNEERKRRGKPPLTPEGRPDMGAAPERKRRSDLGKARPKKTAEPDADSRGDSESPLNEDAPSNSGGTESPARGDCESHEGGLRDPQTSPSNPPRKTPRPSVPDADVEQQDGGTDGSDAVGDKKPATSRKVAATPGVELLLAIGADQPELLLTGKTLSDQGLMVTGMLAEGWTEQQLRHLISRPLPNPIRASVGAIVARRLRDAIAGPVPSSAPRLPEQSGWPVAEDGPTPTPPSLSEQLNKLADRSGECIGDHGLCGRPTTPGNDLCSSCVAAAEYARTSS